MKKLRKFISTNSCLQGTEFHNRRAWLGNNTTSTQTRPIKKGQKVPIALINKKNTAARGNLRHS